jgi:hypothetical protein
MGHLEPQNEQGHLTDTVAGPGWYQEVWIKYMLRISQKLWIQHSYRNQVHQVEFLWLLPLSDQNQGMRILMTVCFRCILRWNSVEVERMNADTGSSLQRWNYFTCLGTVIYHRNNRNSPEVGRTGIQYATWLHSRTYQSYNLDYSLFHRAHDFSLPNANIQVSNFGGNQYNYYKNHHGKIQT